MLERMSDDPARIAPWTVLGDRYELGTRLGHGGMAEVFRGYDRVLSREVAVKLLHEGVDESGRARFMAEARTLAGLSHTGLVIVLDAGFDTAGGRANEPGAAPSSVEKPYLVMELVDGPALSRVLAEGPMALDDVTSIGAQVAHALAYVHRQGVVHRDVKPGNVLLGPAGRVKLADFGIARLLDDQGRHTRTGQTIGTAAYLAPEQLTGGDVGVAADVYSLGLVLLEAITGRREYTGNPTEAALARLHRPPAVPQHLPAPWPALLAAMTSTEPAARPDAHEVAELLEGQVSRPLPAVTESTPDAVTSPLLGTAGTETRTSDANQTRVLTAATPSPAQGAGMARTAFIDRAGDALARYPRTLLGRLRDLPPHQRPVLALAGAAVVLVVLIVIGAIVSDEEPDRTPVPADTPAQLREPLQQLHDAVEEAGR